MFQTPHEGRAERVPRSIAREGTATEPVQVWPLERLRPHPDAALIPAMDERQFRGFRTDVARRGLIEPLHATPEGLLLDGRSRLRAAQELGLKEVPVRSVSPADEVEHMVLCMLRRSHLSPSQRVALVVGLPQVKEHEAQADRRRQANLRGTTEVATLPPRGEKTRDLVARLGDVSARTAQDALTVRDADAALLEAVKSGKLPVDKAARHVRQAQQDERLEKAPPMPEGPFELILADPPWQLGGDPESAYAPENHYPTLPLAEIKALAVPAADDAVLFLWTPACLLPQALEVMAAWGFEFKGEMIWNKPSAGLGNWVRYRHEPLLLGRRGRFGVPEPELRCQSVVEAPRGRHSEKPAVFYELIERMYPEASKLELFARRARAGWTAFGNEVAA